jgi:hypothetical protein
MPEISEEQTGEFPEVYEASPIVTVDFLDQRLSITKAVAWADALRKHIDTLLLPRPDWYWTYIEAVGDHHLACLCAPGFNPGEFSIAGAKGWVHRRPLDGLYQCWLRGDHDCGLTNDLNDAKYLVAEAVRVQLAERSQQNLNFISPLDGD